MNSLAGPIYADSAFDLIRSGYLVIWEGYASIDTCVNNEDAHALGPYIFLCDKYTYEYPYHYGTVYLMAKPFEYDGRTIYRSYLCLDGKDECFEGSIYHR